MNETITCQFAVLRFLPYPETQEFVNVGVVIGCPEIGVFDFQMEMQRRERVTGFFPEMNPDVYLDGRRMFRDELLRLRRIMSVGRDRPAQLLLPHEQLAFATAFREVVRPRESVFRFGGVGVSLAADPAREMGNLFDHYVRRQFATQQEYHETVMTNRLRRLFLERDVRGFDSMDFDDGLYRVTIPFVHAGTNRVLGIKPLHLDKADTTRILDYGDHWCARIRRLHRMARHPDDLILVIGMPTEGRRYEAAMKAREDIQALDGVTLLAETERDRIVSLAKAG